MSLRIPYRASIGRLSGVLLGFALLGAAPAALAQDERPLTQALRAAISATALRFFSIRRIPSEAN